MSAVNGGKPNEPAPMTRPGVGSAPSMAVEPTDPDLEIRRLAYMRYLRDHHGAQPDPETRDAHGRAFRAYLERHGEQPPVGAWDWQTELPDDDTD